MDFPLYDHQNKIIQENKLWSGLWLGTGSGKTRVALEMAEGRTLVIAPKTTRDDKTWQRNQEKYDIILNLTVISKEEFRRDWEKLPSYDTIIIDEAHTFLSGVSPETRLRNGVVIPKKSKLFDGLIQYLKKNPPKRLYALSATPASKPMNVWAMGTIFGKRWDFFAFREKYYFVKKKGYREFWLPRGTKELKEKLASLIKEFGYTGGLNDYFDVPEQTFVNVHVELSSEQKNAIQELNKRESDPMKKKSCQRLIENGCEYYTKVIPLNEKKDTMTRSHKLYKNEKVDYILERAEEFPKMLIFANYKAQIQGIKEALEKAGKIVFTLTGETKNRSEMLEMAEIAKECIVIAQSTISAGYELPSFPVVIFASLNYQYLHYEQAKGRVLRSNHLKKNLYIHLITKNGEDENCFNAIKQGEDFYELVME